MNPGDSMAEKFVGNDTDPLLVQAIEEYQALLDAGDRPDPEAFLRQYAAVAEELADCIGNLELLRDFDLAEQSDHSGSLVRTEVGDFRILREIGRGGMGVVYEANQLSLARRVALKVLPFASVLDSQQLQRFKNEAMAAAALDHPNIVRVYGTGCERSIHFYAMHLVQGQTLAQVIADRRSFQKDDQQSVAKRYNASAKSVDQDTQAETTVVPARCSPDTKKAIQANIATVESNRDRTYMRSIAEIGKQAANTLDYAHSVGIVHRDVKPSNLMVDDVGKCWITDFGLARIETGPNLTITGDLLGTLRYMSPEQASSKRTMVDHRTDIYSLGATLYELLTLKPVLHGNDRHELFQQLTFEDPLSPRRINNTIPIDLETIVLKALAKCPAERYETAAHLANDLEAFLTGRPIAARRPGIVMQTRKWISRHRIVSAVAASLMLVLMLGAGAAMVKHETSKREAKTLVKTNLAAANASLKASDLQQANEHIQAVKDVVRQNNLRDHVLLAQVDEVNLILTARRRAQERFNRFQQLVSNLPSALGQNADPTFDDALDEYNVLRGKWSGHPDFKYLSKQQLKQLKQQIAETLFLAGWQQVRDNDQEPPARRRETSRNAINYWLRIEKVIDEPSSALHLWLADAWDDVGEQDLAANARARDVKDGDRSALDFYVRGRYLQDHDEFERAVKSFSRALRRDPGHIWSLQAMGMALLDAERPAVAEPYYLNLIHRLPKSSISYFGRGMSLLRQGKFDLAAEDFVKVHELEPDNYWGPLWAGKAFTSNGDHASALEMYQGAVELNPNSPRTRLDLAKTYVELKDDDEAKKQLDTTIDQTTKLVGYHRGAQRILPGALLERAKLHLRCGRREKAASDAERAARVANDSGERFAMRDVAWFYLRGPKYLYDPQKALPLAEASVQRRASEISLFILAVAQYHVGEHNRAVQTAIQIIESEKHYSQTHVHFLLAASYWHLEEHDLARKWYDRGVEDGIDDFRAEADMLPINSE